MNEYTIEDWSSSKFTQQYVYIIYAYYTQYVLKHPDSPLVTYLICRFILHELCCFYVMKSTDDTICT
jgi:hypothetical protein